MTRAAVTSLDPIPPEQAAEMLFHRGVGLLAVRDDTGMTERLAGMIAGTSYRVRQLPDDYEAVRDELHRLWSEVERSGRSRECARYHPDPRKRS